MMARPSRRTSIITCPSCGHMEVRARICDIEMKCRRCHYRFEAVIGPSPDTVCDQNERSSSKPDVSKENHAGPSKPKPYQP
jgi:hypothetical protein